MRHGLDTGFLVAFEAADHSQHTASHALVRQCLSNGDGFALAPQVLAELVHVLTDQNRFAQPSAAYFVHPQVLDRTRSEISE
jgi:predicted nucleic acid-binding protein